MATSSLSLLPPNELPSPPSLERELAKALVDNPHNTTADTSRAPRKTRKGKGR